MATSPRTLDQVRSILGKLDRRIDALREARVTPAAPVRSATPPSAGPLIGQASPQSAPTQPSPSNPANQLIGGGPIRFQPTPTPPPAQPPAPPSPNRSMYGRATPLRKAE